MSTKAIEKVLRDVGLASRDSATDEAVAAALTELANIQRAAKALTTGGDMGEVTFANNLMENIAKDAPK